MIVIRQEQIDKIQAGRENEFVHATAHFYCRNFPDFVRGLDDEALRRRIYDAIGAAHSLHITDRDATEQYVAMAILGGPTFIGDPQIRSYLERPGKSPEQRLRELLKRVKQKLESFAGPRLIQDDSSHG